MHLVFVSARARAVARWSALVLLSGWSMSSQAGDYRPPDQRTIYDGWMREIADRQSARDLASARVPGGVTVRDDSARLATERFLRERFKEDDAYNARVGRENARIEAQNADYARLNQLIAQVKAGNVPAMRRYGFEMIARADSGPREKEIGRSWLREAARYGDAEAEQWVARQNADGARQAAEVAKQKAAAASATRSRQLAAEAAAGDVAAMRTLGLDHYFEGTPEEKRSSRAWLDQAVAHNDVATLEFLIDQTRWGTGTPEELAEALAWRVRLAQLPDQTEMCYKLGEIFLTGQFGAPKDRAAALPYLEKAAAAGRVDAGFRIAESFARGLGGPRDAEQAIVRYEAALAQATDPRWAGERSKAILALSLLVLEPTGEAKAHAAALLSFWDECVTAAGEEADAVCRLAADALATGKLGFSDIDREILYFSRPARYGGWPGADAQELADLALHFGETVVLRRGDTAHPLLIVEKQEKRFTSGGSSWTVPVFVKVVAKPADVLGGLMFAALKAPRPQVRAFLIAGFVAAELSEKELEAEGRDADVAFKMFDGAAAKFDDATGWLESGRLLLVGRGVARDPLAAQRRLQTAWDKGAAQAALYLALLHQRRLVPDASEKKYAEWLQRGSEKADPACMEHWGNYLVASGRSQTTGAVADASKISTGIGWLQKAAEAGRAGAMADLADIYFGGIGGPKDAARALQWLRRGAEGGSGKAQRDLAQRLARGEGVEKDQPQAMKLLFVAAQNDLTAANQLGVILWRGDWGEKDVADGLRWMEIALANGGWSSGRNLAKIYHLGLGVPADEAKAREYLEKSGAAAGVESARAVAELYAAGEVIEKDPDAAERWRKKAAAGEATRD